MAYWQKDRSLLGPEKCPGDPVFNMCDMPTRPPGIAGPEVRKNVWSRSGSANPLKSLISLTLSSLLLFAALLASSSQPVRADDSWMLLDQRVKSNVYHLSVGVKMRLPGGQYVQYTDNSPRYKFAVFTSFAKDHGYRVVGFGTAFPVKTVKAQSTFFLTNRHVVESGTNVIQECQRFYAAMRLFAEQTASESDSNANLRFAELERIVRLPRTKKSMTMADKTLYAHTVDAIWDCYETYLSKKADAGRLLFDRYKKLVPVSYEIGYFIHAPGPVTQPPLKGFIHKVASKPGDPDLAVLKVNARGIVELELDTIPAVEGEEVQVVGYPIASDQIDVDSAHYYAPTFSTGRITRVAQRMVQIDAPVTNGNSGGPVLSQRGKVLGVVALRAVDNDGRELKRYGSAFSAECVRAFAPDLFGKLSAARTSSKN